MINLKKLIDRILNECDGGCCGGDGGAGGDCCGSTGTGVGDVLGDISHSAGNGFFGPGCFHVPELCNGGSIRRRGKNGKKKKYKFEKGLRVITTYDQLVAEANKNGVEFDYISIPKNKFLEILQTSPVDNERYDIRQFEKYIDYGNDEEYVGLQDIQTGHILAAAVLAYDIVGVNDCYIAELQCLQHGFGTELLSSIISNTENTWFMSDPAAGAKLISFYRGLKFKLEEITLPNSIYNRRASFFIKSGIDRHILAKIRKYIQNNYKQLSKSNGVNTYRKW